MHTNMKRLTRIAALLVSLTLWVGCAFASSTPSADTANQTAGTLLLSIDPEIEIEFDRQGMVVEIEAQNDSGKGLISSNTQYQGQTVDQVVQQLVEAIYKAGYFEQTIDGHAKNIVLKLDDAYTETDAQLLESIAQGVRDAIQHIGVTTVPVIVTQQDITPDGYIGLEKAKEIVLTQLGLSEASFTQRDYELDDGVYELEFVSNGIEYEYEVSAITGKVLKADRERNDDWDDRDDDRDDRYDRDDDDDDDDRYDRDDDDDDDDRYDRDDDDDDD